jgi:quinolinate synthase
MSKIQNITAEELYNRLNHVGMGAVTCDYDMPTCEEMVVKINEINRLKVEQNAIILAHSYVSPEIVYGVADYKGDSYMLSKNAMEAEADTIIFSAVKFMGETAKILNPQKEVLITGTDTGCSLADAVTGQQVRDLRAEYPNHTFMCYINTTADVKAECDVCVTSSNVYNIVEKYPSDKILFLPDKLMGQNVQDEMKRRGVEKEIVLYEGTCYVHEEYDAEMIELMRNDNPGIDVVSHPECSPGIAMHSDYVGSTDQMMKHIAASDKDQFLLLTECGLSARLQVEFPQKQFVGTCNMCKYMKSNTLDNILRVLKEPKESDRVIIDAETIAKSKKCIDEMFVYAEK